MRQKLVVVAERIGKEWRRPVVSFLDDVLRCLQYLPVRVFEGRYLTEIATCPLRVRHVNQRRMEVVPAMVPYRDQPA